MHRLGGDGVKSSSNSRLPMLHTPMSAQGETSPVLWLLKSPVLSLGPRTLRKDAEGAKKSGIKKFIVRCSLCTELCAAKKQRGQEPWTWSGDLSSTLLLPISSPSGRSSSSSNSETGLGPGTLCCRATILAPGHTSP